MTLMHWCIVLAVAGVLAVTAGVAMLWSVGAGCIALGVLSILGAAVLYDPESRR